MSESENTNTFPKAHFDNMSKAAKDFRDGLLRGQLPANLPWRFDDGRGHFDANESAFLAMQLVAMRPGVYRVQYPTLKARSLIPHNFSIDTGAAFIGQESWDGVGAPAVSADYAGDVPTVETKSTFTSTPIFALKLAYEYSIQEARAAMFAGIPLVPRKAMICREEMERKLDDIAFLGDTTTAVKGLFTQSGTTTYTLASTGVAGAKTFDSKAADDVLLDLNEMVAKVVLDTKEIEIPDTLLTPISTRNLISSRRVGDGTSSTILAYYLANQPFIKTVDATYKLESHATAWTGKRLVAYRNDSTRVEMHVPQPFEQLSPQADGFMVKTLCHMRTAGVQLYLPKSCVYSDGC